jgi:hypothetical protein
LSTPKELKLKPVSKEFARVFGCFNALENDLRGIGPKCVKNKPSATKKNPGFGLFFPGPATPERALGSRNFGSDSGSEGPSRANHPLFIQLFIQSERRLFRILFFHTPR